MVDCSLCETHFFLGEKGECDRTNESCICPEGFTGIDDWIVTETCHVNENLVTGIHKVLLALAIIACFISFAALIQLSRRWGAKMKITASSQPLTSVTNSDIGANNPKFNPKRNPRRGSEVEKRMQRIQDLTILLMWVWGLNAICGIFYESTFVFGEEYFHDHHAALALSVTFILFLATEGAAILLYTWYLTLPMSLIKRNCHLLGYDTFIVRYPKLGEQMALLMSFLGFLMPCILFLILPAILKESTFFTMPSKAFAYYSLLNVVLYIVIMTALANSVLYLFRAGEQAIQDRIALTREDDHLKKDLEKMKESIKTISSFRNIVAMIAVNSFVFHILWMTAKGLYQYIFFSVLCSLQYLAISSWTLMILHRTNGGLTPLSPPKTSDNSL